MAELWAGLRKAQIHLCLQQPGEMQEGTLEFTKGFEKSQYSISVYFHPTFPFFFSLQS